MLDIKHLKTLLALSQHASMVAAAEALFLTQSALSHQLASLEHQLDCELYYRKSRPIKLTPAGCELVALAQRVLPDLERTLFQLEAYKSGDKGRLFVGVECHSCYEWLLSLWHPFRKECPDIDFDILTGTSFDPFPSLLKGEVDAVISTDPIEQNELEFLPLFEYEMVIVASREHPLALGAQPVSIQTLAQHTWIHYPVATERLDLFRELFWPAKLQPAHTRTAETTEFILNLVYANKGLALLPDWLVEQAKWPLARLASPTPIVKRLYLGVRAGERHTKSIQTFARLAAES
jgi:LysR family transcriptional regulator for metE and metH